MATGQDVIPQQLLDTLVSLQRDDYKKNDSLRHQNIAESFPAIVYTFSASGWIYIKAIYMSFCVHKDVSVLSHSAFISNCLASSQNENGEVHTSNRQSFGTKAGGKGSLSSVSKFCKGHRDTEQSIDEFILLH